MYDVTGLSVNRRDFWELENIQMKQMSEATEITNHVWIGNTQDAPVSTQEIKDINSITSCSSDGDDFHNNDNPHRFSICIESHDLADMPLPSTLTLARETLNDLGDDKQLPSEIIHFDMYATGVPQEQSEFDVFYARLLCLLNFMQDQTNRKRNILIHCSDGYTETSLLGLTWIMYHLKLTLPQAYLYLQKKRSFFVYACDVPTLRKIEHLLLGDEVIEPQPKRKKSEQYDCIKRLDISKKSPPPPPPVLDDSDESDDFEEDVYMQENNIDLITTHSNNNDNRLLHGDAYINQISNHTNSNNNQEGVFGNIYKQLQLSPTKEEEKLYPWFYSTRFEGSFPSRILPFLYLGNLNHATNPEMLKALNITHIVSVGENADLNSKDFELLFLDNLYDDGIDSIHGRLENVMSFVGKACMYIYIGTCYIKCLFNRGS
jgi:dual specificity MAP kinase phosphatase